MIFNGKSLILLFALTIFIMIVYGIIGGPLSSIPAETQFLCMLIGVVLPTVGIVLLISQSTDKKEVKDLQADIDAKQAEIRSLNGENK